MLLIHSMKKQTKFNPVIRYNPKDGDEIEVRFEGFDILGIGLNRDQYRALRDAIGRFNPSAPASPTPPPPAPTGDDWGN